MKWLMSARVENLLIRKTTEGLLISCKGQVSTICSFQVEAAAKMAAEANGLKVLCSY